LVGADDLLPWLPPDTETLLVTNGPFTLTNRPPERGRFLERVIEQLSIAKLYFGDVLHPKELLGQTVRLAIEGSRRFRPPRDIGELHYEGCEIVVFEESAGTLVRAAMQSLQSRADRRTQLGGIAVACFQNQEHQDTWPVYFAQPEPNILLCATHEGYLKEVLGRMRGTVTGRALPPDLAEWKHVDTGARAWGIRHYSRTESAGDPTSPLHGQAAANLPDSDAIGFTFSCNPNQASAHLCYLTRASDRTSVGGWAGSEDGLAFQSRLVEPGVVKISIAVEKEEAAAQFILLLLARLGHAVFI
jgi:hypothetical protein